MFQLHVDIRLGGFGGDVKTSRPKPDQKALATIQLYLVIVLGLRDLAEWIWSLIV